MDFLIAKGGVAYAAKTGGGAIASIDEINLLAPGAIAVLDGAGTLVAADATAIVGDHITFAQGSAQGTIIGTPIYRPNKIKYNKTTYSAPAAKVMYLGTPVSGGTTYNLNIPTVVAGDTATVEITDLNVPIERPNRFRLIQVVMKGGETAAQIVAALVAKINADYVANKIVIAADSDAGHDAIKFTGVDTDANFSVAGYDVLANADVIAYKEVVFAGTTGVTAGYTVGITSPVPHTVGTGTDTMISALETQASVFRGNMNVETFQGYFWKVTSNVVAGETYNQYFIVHKSDNKAPLIHEENFDQQLVIAIPVSEYDVTEVGTVLDALLLLV